jgi:hypothetical protein
VAEFAYVYHGLNQEFVLSKLDVFSEFVFGAFCDSFAMTGSPTLWEEPLQPVERP